LSTASNWWGWCPAASPNSPTLSSICFRLPTYSLFQLSAIQEYCRSTKLCSLVSTITFNCLFHVDLPHPLIPSAMPWGGEVLASDKTGVGSSVLYPNENRYNRKGGQVAHPTNLRIQHSINWLTCGDYLTT
jgi:hypothetical protein